MVWYILSSSSHSKVCQPYLCSKGMAEIAVSQKATVHHHMASWDGLMALDSQLLSARK